MGKAGKIEQADPDRLDLDERELTKARRRAEQAKRIEELVGDHPDWTGLGDADWGCRF